MKYFVLAAASAALLCAQGPMALPITSMPPGTQIATAGGLSITAGEIQSLLGTGDPAMMNMIKQNPEQFLVNIFVLRYLTSEADKAHLADQSPLKEQLEYLREKVLASTFLNQTRESYNIPEDAINDFYAKNQSRYEMARIKVIAIGFCPAAPKAAGTSDEAIAEAAKAAVAAASCKNKHTEAEAREIANGIVGKIRGGADFVKMVAQYSEDADSKATEGDFGLVTRDNSFKPEIKAAVFELKDGEISNPIPSGNYFYIIKIKERSIQPLSAVREPIIQELKQKHFTDLMTELTNRFKPVIQRPDFFVTPVKPQPGGPPQLIK
jgi:hypothetical protein